MLHSVRELKKYTIGATDGMIGDITDFYFDDEAWVIRYLEVDTGTWLSGRRVLISPFSIGVADRAARVFPLTISKEQNKHSPGIDTDKPVSRQHEKGYLSYYCYPHYWGGSGFWGDGAYPRMMLPGSGYGEEDVDRLRAQASNAAIVAEADKERLPDEDPHLRSCNAVAHYHVHASDGDIGHVEGFLVEEKSWAIRYIIVNTSNWWMGHQVLVAPEWIGEVSWSYQKITVSLSRRAIKDAPAYHADRPLDRDEETALYTHHRHRGYWQEENERAVS
jgi:uncharacterized protein YrrD